MELRTYFSLLLLLTLTCSASAQSKPEPSAQAPAQQPASISETYNDTLKMIKAWLDTGEDDEFGRLFAIGDERTSDLKAACQSGSDEVISAAFLVLHLLGKSEAESCVEAISQKHKGLPLTCSVGIDDACFTHIEEWLAKKQTSSGYDCREDDDDDLLPMPIDDSLIYALILEDSLRSRSAIDGLVAFEKACKEEDTIIGELLDQAQSLILETKEVAHGLKLEPATLQNVIRSSAFFLPPEYRKDSEVDVVARNKTGDRILLDVSYVCGRLCGRWYYVVLRKDGTVWKYTAITMVRIA